jgi:GNAT superfamily N-acetyltransferase
VSPASSHVRVRELVAADRAKVLDGLTLLGQRSLARRFGRPVDPRDASLVRWVDELDGRARVAYGACERSSRLPVGVARYVALAQPDTAEVAVTVVDAWQRCGVGRLLFERLAAHARACGVRRLHALAPADSPAPAALMRSAAGSLTQRVSWGVLELELDLATPSRERCRSSGRDQMQQLVDDEPRMTLDRRAIR